MKTNLLFALSVIASALSTSPALAATCQIGNEDTYLFASPNSVKIVAGIEDGETVIEIKREDIFFFDQGPQRLNVLAAHHNTVISIASDARVFQADSVGWGGVAKFSANLVGSNGITPLATLSCQSN